jgi:hypothetical protein
MTFVANVEGVVGDPAWNKTSVNVKVEWTDTGIDRTYEISLANGTVVATGANISEALVAVNGLDVGLNDLTVNVTESFAGDSSEDQDSDDVNISKLHGLTLTAPNNEYAFLPYVLTSNWTAAQDGLGTLQYRVQIDENGTNQSFLTGSLSLLFNVTESAMPGYVHVRAEDDYFQDDYEVGTFNTKNPATTSDVEVVFAQTDYSNYSNTISSFVGGPGDGGQYGPTYIPDFNQTISQYKGSNVCNGGTFELAIAHWNGTAWVDEVTGVPGTFVSPAWVYNLSSPHALIAGDSYQIVQRRTTGSVASQCRIAFPGPGRLQTDIGPGEIQADGSILSLFFLNLTVSSEQAQPFWNKTADTLLVKWTNDASDNNYVVKLSGVPVASGANASQDTVTTNTFPIGESTVTVEVNETFGPLTGQSNNASDGFNVSKLQGNLAPTPSGDKFFIPQVRTLTWTPATDGIGSILHEVLINTNGSDVTVDAAFSAGRVDENHTGTLLGGIGPTRTEGAWVTLPKGTLEHVYVQYNTNYNPGNPGQYAEYVDVFYDNGTYIGRSTMNGYGLLASPFALEAGSYYLLIEPAQSESRENIDDDNMPEDTGAIYWIDSVWCSDASSPCTGTVGLIGSYRSGLIGLGYDVDAETTYNVTDETTNGLVKVTASDDYFTDTQYTNAVPFETKLPVDITNFQVKGHSERITDVNVFNTGVVNIGSTTGTGGITYEPLYDQYLVQYVMNGCQVPAELLTVRDITNGSIIVGTMENPTAKTGPTRQEFNGPGIYMQGGVTYTIVSTGAAHAAVCRNTSGLPWPVVYGEGTITSSDHTGPGTSQDTPELYNFTVAVVTDAPVWNRTSDRVVVSWDDNGQDTLASVSFGAVNTLVTNQSFAKFTSNSLNVGDAQAVTVDMNETFGSEQTSDADNTSAALSKLGDATNILPNSNVTSNPFNISWTAATGGIDPVTYDVTYERDGVNVSLSTGQNVTYYEVPTSIDSAVTYEYITVYDKYFSTTARNPDAYSIVLNPAFLSQTCTALTYPNEDNLPSKAQIPVNFTIVAPIGFDGNENVNEVTLSLNDQLNITTTTCDITVDSATQHTYGCLLDMEYYFSAGQYDMIINVTTSAGKEAYVNVPNICEYASLLASKRTINTITFPGAGPGTTNIAGTPPMNIRNTGNVGLNLSMEAYDLRGRTDAGETLAASTFKAGDTLPLAVQMNDGVAEDLNMSLAPGAGANEDVDLWLSMPASQSPQEYYTPTPWQLIATG